MTASKAIVPANNQGWRTRKTHPAREIPEGLAIPKKLRQILRRKRRYLSKGWEEAVRYFLLPLEKRVGGENFLHDIKGNVWVQILRKDGSSSKVIWSCHTDTVHDKDDKGLQNIELDPNGWVRLVTDDSAGSCLGADDGAGWWLMLEMIGAGVPGMYLFHAGEEVGGIGSKYIADKCRKFLEKYQVAIALDRMGDTEVITAQRGGICASDAFARDLAERLELDLEPSKRGIYTDTAEYMRVVPECSNLGIGHIAQHSTVEELDLVWLLRLRDALVRGVDERFEELVVKRDPSVVESRWGGEGVGGYYYGAGAFGYNGEGYGWETEDWKQNKDDWRNKKGGGEWIKRPKGAGGSVTRYKPPAPVVTQHQRNLGWDVEWNEREWCWSWVYSKHREDPREDEKEADNLEDAVVEAFARLIGEWPMSMALFLADYGIDRKDFVEYLSQKGIVVPLEEWEIGERKERILD